MNNLVPIIIVPAIIYGIYSIFKLFAQRKERMAIIEKLSEGIDPSIINQFGNSNRLKIEIDRKSPWTIRIGCLLFGIGLGIGLVALLDAYTSAMAMQDLGSKNYDREIMRAISNSPVQNAFTALYPASAALFGGLGLIIAFFVERKYKLKSED